MILPIGTKVRNKKTNNVMVVDELTSTFSQDDLNNYEVIEYPVGTQVASKRNGAFFEIVVSDVNKTILSNDNGSVSSDTNLLHMEFDFVTTPSEQSKPKVTDHQEGGDHYKKLGVYQPREVLKAWLTPEEFRGYMKGTAIAHLAREQDKGGDLDIKKATHTLQGLIELGELK